MLMLNSVADELVKIAVSPLATEMAKSTVMGMGIEGLLNRDATPLSVAREGAGFGVGEVGASALARGMGYGKLGRFLAGMVGGGALAGALRKRFADKPVQRAIDKLPDTPEFRAIKQAAAKSVLTPQSSNVAGYSYDPKTQSLNVTYKGGGTYTYKGVQANAVRALRRNKSVGKTINKLRAGLEYEKIGGEYTEYLRALSKNKKRKTGLPKLAKQTAFGEDHYDEADDAGWKDKIPGGLADDKFPTDFDFDALDKGIKVELEHTKDRRMAMEIAMDHLTEDPAYYDKLEKIEKKANGDMIEYFKQHPRKLKERQERLKKNPPKYLREKKADIIKTAMLRERIREGAPSIVGNMAANRRSMLKAAGVAKKQISFDGLPLKIEHEPGDTRTGTSKDGKTWSRKMSASYGYVPGTKGMAEDGDAIDVYLAASPVPGKVYTVRQNKKDGSFDESKHMLGYPSAADAKADYLKHMPEWAFGSMESESWDSFKGKYGKKAA